MKYQKDIPFCRFLRLCLVLSTERMREASTVPKGWRTAGVIVKAAMVKKIKS